MIHLTNEEYDNLLRQIDEKTEYIALCTKERNEQKQRADELEDRISEEIRKRFQLEDRWRKAYERADELERRWSELVDVLKKKYEYYKVRADDESAGSIEQGKWKIAKHELMMVLKIMTDLKRGETE